MTPTLLLSSGYPLLDVFWTILMVFGFVIWFWLLFMVLADLFRRRDESGWVKALWVLFVIFFPLLGILAYLIFEHEGMTERTIAQQQAAKAQMDEYVRTAADGADPTAQVARAKELLDSGAVTQAEFDQMKRHALAGTQA